ncbi:MAG: carboxypeptidase-like regulatory domain-containing protein [Bacteroidetes bacterium]|nr:carboxypeptidase-like regulatory domain-containing protein [Bacteroidota bacterium]
MRFLFFISILFIPFAFNYANAQTYSDSSFVKVSGIIVDSDSITPIPFVNIINKRTRTGTISDTNGFFKISILRTDTILFSSLSFEKKSFYISDTTSVSYFFKIIMNNKNYKLAVVNIYALSKQSQFRYDFVHVNLPEHIKMKGRAIYIPGIPNYDGPRRALDETPLGGPISFFYSKFNKKEKSKRKLKQLLKKDEINRIINSKYNDKIVCELTGLKSDKLNEFIKFCDFDIQYLLKNNEYDIYIKIMQNFKEFKSKKTPQKKQ